MDSVERLTEYFVPEHYKLALTLDEQNHKFSGKVEITGESTGQDFIKLHAKDLHILSAEIDEEKAVFSTGNTDTHEVSVDNLPAGKHTVVVEFSGDITDQMHGLYPCYYEVDGVKKELFATQFESHHAREMFPCIDEPAAKATFELELNTAKHDAVLSNMPIINQDKQDDRLVTLFEATPRMSTYLLAFVVGDLHKKSAKTKSGVEVNVWATAAQPASHLDFPLDIAVRAIEFYDEYFDTPYPLPKSDHVALPDFSSGAMENWGLITYREMALLADPATTSIGSYRYVATVIAHELAHQWFGNLVTMEWWNDLWLNESFATLMEYISVDALEPDWKIWLDFDTNESVVALQRDSYDGVQAVQVDVNSPDEISTLFDGAIVYAKGARLLRMIQTYVGKDAFRAALKEYFKKHAYGNTVGNDLWNQLGAASGEPVADIMNTWISQSGFPVVSITSDGDKTTLKQKQFLRGPHAESTKTWPIPLGSDSPNLPRLMRDTTLIVDGNQPLRLNNTNSAHFITNYDEKSLSALLAQIKDGSLDTYGRMQILNEGVLLANGGVISNAKLLDYLQAYEDETLEPVWDMISLALGNLRKFVEDDLEAEKALRGLSAQIARKHYERLGWQKQADESSEDTKLRNTVIGLTLYGEVPEALATAREIYDSTPLEEIDSELRPLIISSVVRYGDASVVDTLIDIYRKSSSPELKQDINIGVTSTRIPAKISELLDSLKDSDTIRPQDVFRWFVYLVRGRESRDLTWQWTRDNWQWIVDTFGGDKNYEDFPRYVASGLKTPKQLSEYREFFGPLKDEAALTRAITVGITEIEDRVELIQRDTTAVTTALKALGKD